MFITIEYIKNIGISEFENTERLYCVVVMILHASAYEYTTLVKRNMECLIQKENNMKSSHLILFFLAREMYHIHN